MSDERNEDWRKLTFAQREGKALPEELEVGKLSQQFRLRMWECVDHSISLGWKIHGGLMTHWDFAENCNEGRFWKNFVRTYFLEIRNIPHDAHPVTEENFFGRHFRTTILEGEAWVVLTLLECMLRTQGLPNALAVALRDAFEKSPYFLDDSAQPVCIMPADNKESKETIQHALDVLQKSGMEKAAGYLRKSAQRINERDYEDSLQKAMLAVENVACKIAGKDAALGAALKILEKNKLLENKQLKAGFEKLYTYTNKVPGARHANAFKDGPPPGADEALFMYGACAVFVGYLAKKHRAIKSD